MRTSKPLNFLGGHGNISGTVFRLPSDKVTDHSKNRLGTVDQDLQVPSRRQALPSLASLPGIGVG